MTFVGTTPTDLRRFSVAHGRTGRVGVSGTFVRFLSRRGMDRTGPNYPFPWWVPTKTVHVTVSVLIHAVHRHTPTSPVAGWGLSGMEDSWACGPSLGPWHGRPYAPCDTGGGMTEETTKIWLSKVPFFVLHHKDLHCCLSYLWPS